NISLFYISFFLSSRRLHTISKRDWSSDVCSSDLSAIIHTLTFGDPFRKMCDNAKTLLPSAEKRGAAGSSLDLAIKHKMDSKIRSHHMTYEIRIPDAPKEDEILISAVVTTSGRANHRIGSLSDEQQT